jgi:nitrate reductase delta subunit
MTQTLKALAVLLSYPSEEMRAAYPEILSVLEREEMVSGKFRRQIEAVFAEWADEDLMNLQEEYVFLFDRTPSLSLHLFEHVHGDSKGRGQALVELDGLYRERGLENASEHTPDYLPMFLEYISLLPPEEATENLNGAIDVIAVLGERLKKRESSYAVFLEALQDIASRKPNLEKVKSALAVNAGQGPTEEEMDLAWEEQFALGEMKEGEGGGCPMAEEMLARMGIQSEEMETRK